jgi:UDP-glucose 4-epimerase
VLLNVVLGKKTHMDLFGTDYPTKDGTCVRDYIHVWDLVEAHLVLLENLKEGQGLFYNLGVGHGYSNREIIESVQRVTGKKIPVKEAPRRAGDPPELYADPAKIKRELGWSAKYTNLDEIVKTAWTWFQKNPNGYGR